MAKNSNEETKRRGKGLEDHTALSVNRGIRNAIEGKKSDTCHNNSKRRVLTPELQEYIRDKLTKQTRNKSELEHMVDIIWKTAKENPESYERKRIVDMIFWEDNYLAYLDEQLAKQNNSDIEYQEYKVRKTLYDRQQEVFDNNHDNNILVINSRRSGKTELLGRLAVKDLLQPNHRVVYINRNSTSAIRQISGPFNDAMAAQNLITITKGSIANQEVHFSNGSMMLVLGNNNSADIDKLRGEKASLVILDECGHQRNMRQLIREVIKPLLMDYGEEAKLVMVGTPPRNSGTYIEECYNNAAERGWKLYHWTFQDNPFIPDKENVIQEVCKENGCTPDSAFIQREYFGRMGVYDLDAKYIKKWATVERTQLPNVFTHAYVGVDWGFEDRAAVVSVLADNVSKRAYVVDCWSEAKKGINEISNEIKRQVSNLAENFNISRPVQVICDDNEKGAVADLVHVYKLKHVYCAYKYNKDMALDQLSDLMGGNRINVLKDTSEPLIEDINNTLWKRDEETDKILHEIDDEVWHPNALMALLYVSRQFAYEVCRFTDKNKQASNILDGIDMNSNLEEIYNPVQ